MDPRFRSFIRCLFFTGNTIRYLVELPRLEEALHLISEIGAGSGYYAIYASVPVAKQGPSYRIRPRFCRLLQRETQRFRKKISWKQGSVLALPVETASADLVAITQVIENIDAGGSLFPCSASFGLFYDIADPTRSASDGAFQRVISRCSSSSRGVPIKGTAAKVSALRFISALSESVTALAVLIAAGRKDLQKGDTATINFSNDSLGCFLALGTMHDLPHFEIAVTEMVQVTLRAILVSRSKRSIKTSSSYGFSGSF